MSPRAPWVTLAVVAAWIAVTAPSAVRAAGGVAGVIGTETMVVVPDGPVVSMLVDVTWARRPSGRREFVTLPQGFTSVEALHPRLPVHPTAAGAWVSGRPRSVALNVVFQATTPFLLDETTSVPTRAATLLVDAGAYPSGSALAPFTYEGRTRLGGRTLRVFLARDIARGTQIFIPIALSDPISVERAAVAVSLTALAALSLVGAAWWTLHRFGHTRAGPVR